MWLVTSHSPLVSARNSITGVGMIDAFFDSWLPVFVHEARNIGTTRWAVANGLSRKKAREFGKAYADSMYQEVVSVDGLSKVRSTVCTDLYEQTEIDRLKHEATTGPMSYISTHMNQFMVHQDHKEEEDQQLYLSEDYRSLQKRFLALQERNQVLKKKNKRLKQMLSARGCLRS